jgi:hypothetical protein
MTKERMDISVDSEIAMQLKEAAFKKYGNLRSTSRFIEDLFKGLDNKPIDIGPIITNKEVVESEVPNDKTPKMTHNEARAKLGLPPIDKGGDEPIEPHQSSFGSCDPWEGPWICNHCNGYWAAMSIHHAPVACPGCGKKDGIRRLTEIGQWNPS